MPNLRAAFALTIFLLLLCSNSSFFDFLVPSGNAREWSGLVWIINSWLLPSTTINLLSPSKRHVPMKENSKKVWGSSTNSAFLDAPDPYQGIGIKASTSSSAFFLSMNRKGAFSMSAIKWRTQKIWKEVSSSFSSSFASIRFWYRRERHWRDPLRWRRRRHPSLPEYTEYNFYFPNVQNTYLKSGFRNKTIWQPDKTTQARQGGFFTILNLPSLPSSCESDFGVKKRRKGKDKSELHFNLLLCSRTRKSQLTTNDAKEGDFREKEEKITFWGGWKRGRKSFSWSWDFPFLSSDGWFLVGQLGFGRKKDFLFWLCRLL